MLEKYVIKTRYFVIFIIFASFTIDEAFSEHHSENCELPSTCDINPGEELIEIPNLTNENSSSTENNNRNNRCSGDCIAPTFYKDKAGVPIVKDGFIFNGNSTDVTGYHTSYPLITVNTNETHNIKLKVYEENQLRWFQIGFGMPEVGAPFNDAESLATFYINFQNDTLDRVETVDKYSLIDILNATVNKVPCGYNNLECYELSADFVARDQLKNNIVAIQAVDHPKYSATHYINDGILIVGESINEPIYQKTIASKGGAFYPQKRGTVELTLIDYKTDTWQDPYGYHWTNEYSPYIIDTISPPTKEPDKLAKSIDFEIERAMKYFNATYR